MNIHKRFVVQFFFQLTIVFILFFFLVLSFWGIIGFTIMNEEPSHDLSKAESYYFEDKITVKKNKAIFDDDLKQDAKKQEGWFLVITEKGKVIGSFRTPKQLPAQFSESELAALTLQPRSLSTEYTFWELKKSGQKPMLLVFGKENIPFILLNKVKPDVDWKEQQLALSPAALQLIKEENGWVRLVSSNGKIIDHFGEEKKTGKYSKKELLSLAKDEQNSTAAYHDDETKLTIITGIDDSILSSSLEDGVTNAAKNSFLIIIALLFLFLLLGTFWYARKFGVPLLTMMKWIQNLGSGIYEQPVDLQQQPLLQNKKGKLKRKYRLYKDLIATLTVLTETLRHNESQQRKMAKTREEWISGLSHDLKTPLSSISGFAQMMESDTYSWTEAEKKEFAGIIAEKSSYMMELLEDLTLTYRLSNQALPISKEKVDMNEFIRRTIIHFVNDPANSEKEFTFQPYEGSVFASVDPKWFQRIIDNLIGNAVKFNPAGTAITVSTSLIEQHLIVIKIEDDGIGMDNETVNKLFQRYYRGTNTSESGSGTGLGMAITKQLVEVHGGSINVKSTLKEGTVFRILLPTEGHSGDTLYKTPRKI
ncbi:sensor histidine kinase [Mesobacillus zeae]|uniref:histidine kinase n=1 Tax=Mesobacillus zeae TaxID=1917180 RepID=A0A398B2L4_9BACI|nr:HAMP domain-containing sensor histidine kinase [Mesobacillus zeae]RID83584.1 sensor histidine kinase [Mesobacillus zeae]